MNAISRKNENNVEFYRPDTLYQPKSDYFEPVSQMLPRAWRLKQDHFWTFAIAPHSTAPVQGWKIHISALPQSALRILRTVAAICFQHQTEFKFASDPKVLYDLLGKNASRQSSGKFITIYPATTLDFHALLEALHEKLSDEQGPYILSDRQYRNSSVIFYRYGGFKSFAERDVDGARKRRIFNEDFTFIEEMREPKFEIPAFVNDDLNQMEEIADPTATPSKFDEIYEMQAAIKHSNAGGVYVAMDRQTHKTVLIKEARPFIGLDLGGIDAIERLAKEYRILAKIQDAQIAPAPIEFFKEWQHGFLVQEFVEGQTVRQFLAKSNKLIYANSSRSDLNRWMRDVVKIALHVLDIVEKLHAYNIVFGDLSPNNLMIQADLTVKLIDFEGALEVGVDRPINMYTPGFGRASRRWNKSVDVRDDVYALGCLLIGMLAPNPTLIQMNENFVSAFFEELRHDMDIPDQYIQCVRSLLSDENPSLEACRNLLKSADFGAKIPDRPASLEPDWDGKIEKIFKYNLGVMDPSQKEHMFPVSSKTTDCLAVDHGMLGIAYAWNMIKGDIPPEFRVWLQTKFHTEGLLPGLMNGLSGMSWVLHEIGHTSESQRALEAARFHRLLFKKMSLGYGAAGYGLCNLRLWQKTKGKGYLDEARNIGDVICDRAQATTEGCYWDAEEDVIRVGLMGGASGIALFLLYLHAATQDARYLEVGIRGLAFDIAQGRLIEGSLGFPTHVKGGILYPYLAHGSAGIGTVALRYYLLTRNPLYLDLIRDIKFAIAQKYTITPDLDTGLAGLGNFLLDLHVYLQDESYRELALRVSAGLQLFEIHRGEGMTFPYLLSSKINTDYAHGSAGIALFLNRLAHGGSNFHFMLDEFIDAYIQKGFCYE